MKRKFILLGLVAAVFTTNAYARCGYGYNYHYEEDYAPSIEYHRIQSFYKKEFHEMRIFIKEKKLEIEKEMLKDNPDWHKIEKLNAEIENKKSALRIETMKKHHEEIRKSIERNSENS